MRVLIYGALCDWRKNMKNEEYKKLSINEFTKRKAGLKVEKFEIRKGMRMHCVVRKPMGEGDRQ